MNLQLTVELLEFLKDQGFRYCFSKTKIVPDNEIVKIYLTPTKYKPSIKRLPKAYDTYFSINQEPTQMAEGVDGLIVLAVLDLKNSALYIRRVLRQLKLEKHLNLNEPPKTEAKILRLK